MSLLPSRQEEAASSSPESPREGDFSRQFYDNLKSLEEPETCDDKRGPIVNNTPDNYSSSLLNAQICASLATNDLEKVRAGISPQEQTEKSHWREPQDSNTSGAERNLHGLLSRPASPHFMEVHALDGRFITLVSTQTQTDWEWVEQSRSFSCQVQKEVGELQVLQAEKDMDTVPVSLKEPEDEEMPEEEYDVPCLGRPRLIAYKPEPKQTPRVQKVVLTEFSTWLPPEAKSKRNVHLARCDYCQQLCQPFTYGEPLKNETHFERLFCCERAKQMRELIQEERKNLERKEFDRKIDVEPCGPISNEERETVKEPRIKELRQHQKKRRKDNFYGTSGYAEAKQKNSYYKLLNEARDKTSIPKRSLKIIGMLTPQEEIEGEPKIKEVIQKFYKSGKCFLTLCPDGTGNVLYPSGNAAIIISSVDDDFTYIILEDKDTAPSIKGIFTNKGHSTCYHPNGLIWLNLTPGGGLCFNETGDLKRRWNWTYFDPHVHSLPFKPLIFTLGPHISVRIHSQECMYVTFAHKANTVRFSVGSKLEPVYLESHSQPCQSVLEQYIQMKNTEILSLLCQMQTCMSRPAANLHNIKPHYRFIARKERLSKQVEKEKSPEKNRGPCK